jgi:hypothetical protein
MIVSNVQRRRSASIDERMIHDERGSYVSSSPYNTRTIKRRVTRRERREAKQGVRDSRQW